MKLDELTHHQHLMKSESMELLQVLDHLRYELEKTKLQEAEISKQSLFETFKKQQDLEMMKLNELKKAQQLEAEKQLSQQMKAEQMKAAEMKAQLM